MTTLLFDLSGGSHILLAVLRSLHRAPGTYVHVLAEHPLQPVRFSRHVASYTNVESPGSPESVLAQMLSLIRAKRIDVVLPSGVAATRFLSVHRRAVLEVCALTPVPEVEAMELARNKGRLALHMEGSAVPHPRTTIVREPAGALEFFDTLGGPALLKPFLSAGGHGIVRVDDRATLEAALRAGAVTGKYLLQEFIPGYDIDCSVLTDSGTVIAHTVQRGVLRGTSTYAAPGGAEYLDDRGAFLSAIALISSLRWSGIAHVDMRFDERDGLVKIVELNPRYWRSLLGSVAAGVNFPYLACQYALGARTARPAPSPRLYVHESRIALRQIIRQRGRQHPYRFQDTVLAEASRDPLPELALILLPRRILTPREG